MPTYDYYCKFCNRTEERVVGLSDLDKVQGCRVCGDPVERVITRAPVSRFAGHEGRRAGPLRGRHARHPVEGTAERPQNSRAARMNPALASA